MLLVLALNRSVLAGRGDAPPSPSPPSGGPPAAVEVPAPPRSGAADRACPAVISNLPAALADHPARPAHSTSPYVAAWGDPAIILRCGVDRPLKFVVGESTLEINKVQWYVDRREDAVIYTAVDRAAYVEVIVPTAYSSAPIVDVSAAITRALPAQPIRPGR